MSRAPKPIAGSLKVWRPWQRRQFELFQGIAITSSLTHRYSQEYMIVAMQSGAGSLQYRNSREITNAANGIFYVFEPGETWSCQSKDFTFHGFSLDAA